MYARLRRLSGIKLSKENLRAAAIRLTPEEVVAITQLVPEDTEILKES